MAVQAQALKATHGRKVALRRMSLPEFCLLKVQGPLCPIYEFGTPTGPNPTSLAAVGVARTTLSGWAGLSCRSGTAWVLLTTPWNPETLELLYF